MYVACSVVVVLQLLFSVVAVYLECVDFVQARGGCLCAGPYGAQLLGISRDQSKALEVSLNNMDSLVSWSLVMSVGLPNHSKLHVQCSSWQAFYQTLDHPPSFRGID